MSRLETILDRLALGSFFSAVAILSALQVVSATEGCTALRAEAPVITADAAQVAGCIAKQAISGNASALSIGLACVPLGSSGATQVGIYGPAQINILHMRRN